MKKCKGFSNPNQRQVGSLSLRALSVVCGCKGDSGHNVFTLQNRSPYLKKQTKNVDPPLYRLGSLMGLRKPKVKVTTQTCFRFARQALAPWERRPLTRPAPDAPPPRLKLRCETQSSARGFEDVPDVPPRAGGVGMLSTQGEAPTKPHRQTSVEGTKGERRVWLRHLGFQSLQRTRFI